MQAVAEARTETQTQTSAITRSGTHTKGAEALLAIAIVAFCTYLAYGRAFLLTAKYDDEGYMVMSLLNYVKHGGL